MTETAATTPAPKSRKRLLLVLAAIALVVIALVVGGFLYASSSASTKASDYQDDYAAWKDKDQPVLLAATGKVPRGTYLRTSTETRKALATQQKGCDAVASSLTKVEAAADRLPTVDATGLLATISSDYSDAGDASKAREKVVRAYVKDASAALTQIHRDCSWNISYHRVSGEYGKAYAKGEKYLLKPGQTEPSGVFCPKDRGTTCVSSIATKKNTYAKLRIAATRLYRAKTLKTYASKDCSATSYGPVCGVLFKAYGASSKQQLKNFLYIRTMKTSIDNPQLTKNNARLEKVTKRNGPVIKKAVLALDPKVAKNKDVRKYPGWSDNFFSVTAKQLLKDLTAQRTALEKL